MQNCLAMRSVRYCTLHAVSRSPAAITSALGSRDERQFNKRVTPIKLDRSIHRDIKESTPAQSHKTIQVDSNRQVDEDAT